MDYTPKIHNSECDELVSDDDDELSIFGKSCKEKSRASWIRRSCKKTRISLGHERRLDSFAEGKLSVLSPTSTPRFEDKYTTPVKKHKISSSRRIKRRSNISREMFLSIGCRDDEREILGDAVSVKRETEDVPNILDRSNGSANDLFLEKNKMEFIINSSRHSKPDDVMNCVSGLPENSMNSNSHVDQSKVKKSTASFCTPFRNKQSKVSKTPLSAGKLSVVVKRPSPIKLRQSIHEEDNQLVKTSKESIKSFKPPFQEFVEGVNKDVTLSSVSTVCETENASASFIPNVSAFLKDENEVTEDDVTTLKSECRESVRCLEDSVLFVDFRTDNENRGDVIRKVALELGAKVVDKFGPSVTHVIFKDGSKVNYKRAKIAGIPILSASWLEETKRRGKKMLESDFPSVSVELYDTPEVLKKRRKSRSMQPKSLDEEFMSVSKAHLRKAKLSERKAMREQEAVKLRVQVLDKYPPHEHYYKGSRYDNESVKNTPSESSLHDVLRVCAPVDEDVLNADEVFGRDLKSFSPENDYEISLAEKLVKKYQSPSIQETKHSMRSTSANCDDADVTTPSRSDKNQTDVATGQNEHHIIQRLSLTPSLGDSDSDEGLEDAWPGPDDLLSNDLGLRVRPKRFLNPFKHSPKLLNKKRKFDSDIQDDGSAIPLKRLRL